MDNRSKLIEIEQIKLKDEEEREQEEECEKLRAEYYHLSEWVKDVNRNMITLIDTINKLEDEIETLKDQCSDSKED